MKIEIKHILTDVVLFSHEQEENSLKITLEFAIKSRAYLGGAYLRGADLSGADLSGADLGGADLRGADMSGADLRGSDLRGADLRGADMSGADLEGANMEGATHGKATLNRGVLQLLGKFWPVYIFDAHIKIGCQMHSTEEWESFSNDQISKMANNALEFWRENKEVILTLAKHHQNKAGE